MRSRQGGTPSSSAPAVILAAALAASAALFLLLVQTHRGALVDDAYISFRYAVRWAAGRGLTWNDGSAVEGFSNPLWTFSLGIGAKLGIAPEQAAPWLGLAFLLATVAGCWGLAARRGFHTPAIVVFVGGLALDGGLALWAGSGLEPSLASFLMVLWLWLAAGLPAPGQKGETPGLGGGVALGLVGAGLVLSRPEGGIWTVWGFLWLVWGAWVERKVLLGWLAGMTPVMVYEVFRWRTYGSLLPNTFFAKLEAGFSSWGHGAGDLLGWVWAHAAIVALMVFWGGVLVARRGEPRAQGGAAPRLWWLLPVGYLVEEVLFVFLAGGDWMGHTRYLAPVLPAFYLLAGEAWNRMELRLRTPAMAVLVGALLIVHPVIGWVTRDTIPRYTRVGAILGRWLASVSSPGDSVGVTAAGAIPYYSGLPAYDILGINDPQVAGRPARHVGAWAPGHHRYDLDSLLELHPKWIVWDFGVQVNERRVRELRRWSGNPDRLDYRRALLARAEFRETYQIDHSAPRETQNAYTVFRRR